MRITKFNLTRLRSVPPKWRFRPKTASQRALDGTIKTISKRSNPKIRYGTTKHLLDLLAINKVAKPAGTAILAIALYSMDGEEKNRAYKGEFLSKDIVNLVEKIKKTMQVGDKKTLRVLISEPGVITSYNTIDPSKASIQPPGQYVDVSFSKNREPKTVSSNYDREKRARDFSNRSGFETRVLDPDASRDRNYQEGQFGGKQAVG